VTSRLGTGISKSFFYGVWYVAKGAQLQYCMLLCSNHENGTAVCLHNLFYVTDGNIMYLTDASRSLISCVIQHYAPVVGWGGGGTDA
jgi:hypothetical protein